MLHLIVNESKGVIDQNDPHMLRGWSIDLNSNRPSNEVEIFIDDFPLISLKADIPRMDVKRSYGRKESGFLFAPQPSLTRTLPQSYKICVKNPTGWLRCGKGVNATISNPNGDGTFREKIESGFQVSPKGYLFRPPSSSEQWCTNILKSYELGREACRVLGNVELTFGYGSLLGAVRENNFIAHDDDFDASYFVSVDTTENAAQHFVDLVKTLRQHGFKADFCKHFSQGNFYFSIPELGTLDIFIHYHLKSSGLLCGYQFAEEFPIDHFTPAASMDFRGSKILVPKNSNDLLTAVYGQKWRKPDPTFQWRPSNIATKQMKLFGTNVRRLLQNA